MDASIYLNCFLLGAKDAARASFGALEADGSVSVGSPGLSLETLKSESEQLKRLLEDEISELENSLSNREEGQPPSCSYLPPRPFSYC
jgi:hypothetical protein